MKKTKTTPAKREPSERFALPVPVKLDKPTAALVKRLKNKSSFTSSEILRRAVRYAVPKFLSGELNILDVPELPAKEAK